jgi:hypothetical protein
MTPSLGNRYPNFRDKLVVSKRREKNTQYRSVMSQNNGYLKSQLIYHLPSHHILEDLENSASLSEFQFSQFKNSIPRSKKPANSPYLTSDKSSPQ